MNGCARGSDLIRGNFNRIQRKPEIKGVILKRFLAIFHRGEGVWAALVAVHLLNAYFTSLRNITPSAESEKPSIGSFKGKVFEVFSQ